MPRRGLDRARVVDAACAIADAEGLDALSVARVAASLGVRGPSIYNHVGSREELLGAVGERGAVELGDALRDAAVGRSGADTLRALCGAYRAYAVGAPGRYAATQRIVDAKLAAATAPVVAVVLAVLAGLGLSGDAAIHATRAIRSALHGFALLESSQGFAMGQDVEETFEVLVRTLVHGITA